MNSGNENLEDGFTLNMLLDFVRKVWVKTAVRVAVSFFFALVVFALLYVLLPSEQIFTRDIGLRLQQKANSATFVYPSGKNYVDSDLISQAVLRKVYEKNKLNGRVTFQDFVESFYLSDYTLEQAQVEAAYRAGLSKKNLSVADIQTLKMRYDEDMAKIPRNWRSVSMKKLYPLKRSEQIKIVNEIPAVWFEVYSQLEKITLPQLPSVNSIAELRDRRQGTLATLEISRSYIQRLFATVMELNKLVDGRDIKLKTGESLGELQHQITLLQNYRLPLLYQYFYSSNALKNRFDLLYIRGRLDAIERDLVANAAQQTAAEKALEVVSPRNTALAAASGKGKDNSVNLQLGDSFLPYLTQLVRNDYSNSIRTKIGSELLENKKEIARLETERFFHSRLEKNFLTQKSSTQAENAKEFNSLFEQFQKELASASLKLSNMAELLNNEYMANRIFYVTDGSVKLQKSNLVSPAKLLLGIIALFALYNAVAILLDFNSFFAVEEK